MLGNMCGKIVCLSWVCIESSKDTGPSPTSLERWREESSLEARGSSHQVYLSFLLKCYLSHSLLPHSNWQPHVTFLLPYWLLVISVSLRAIYLPTHFSTCTRSPNISASLHQHIWASFLFSLSLTITFRITLLALIL